MINKLKINGIKNMGFSSIATQKREKEAENLRSFIIYSLIASAALHIGVLSLGIGNFLLARIPEIDSEPIEVAIVELPPEEQVKPPQTKAKESAGGGGGGGGGGGSGGRETSQLPGATAMGLPTNSLSSPSDGAIASLLPVEQFARQSIAQPLPQTNPGVNNFPSQLIQQQPPPPFQEEESSPKVQRLRDILRRTQPQSESPPTEPAKPSEAPAQPEEK